MAKNTASLAGRIVREQNGNSENNDIAIIRAAADTRCNHHKVFLFFFFSKVCNPLKESDESKGPSPQENPHMSTDTQT